MDRQSFQETCLRYYAASGWNCIPKDKALLTELQAAKIYEEPLMAVANAADSRFLQLQQEHVVGGHVIPPQEWLPTARSVISFFFPFTQSIRDSNKTDMAYPSKGWLNARIEGQQALNQYFTALAGHLNSLGYATIIPTLDPRFCSNTGKDNTGSGRLYTSNWSERHVAFICGLGTFGLSKGLITEQGMAGRFGSLITELPLTPDAPRFSRYDENCTMCGKCTKNCPAGAISLQQGKNHKLCSQFLDKVLAENAPWYGCGKCQVNVPCETYNPAAFKKAAPKL